MLDLFITDLEKDMEELTTEGESSQAGYEKFEEVNQIFMGEREKPIFEQEARGQAITMTDMQSIVDVVRTGRLASETLVERVLPERIVEPFKGGHREEFTKAVPIKSMAEEIIQEVGQILREEVIGEVPQVQCVEEVIQEVSQTLREEVIVEFPQFPLVEVVRPEAQPLAKEIMKEDSFTNVGSMNTAE